MTLVALASSLPLFFVHSYSQRQLSTTTVLTPLHGAISGSPFQAIPLSAGQTESSGSSGSTGYTGAQSGSVSRQSSFGQASGFSGSAGEQGGFSRTAGASSGLVNRVANALANSSTMRAVLRRGVSQQIASTLRQTGYSQRASSLPRCGNTTQEHSPDPFQGNPSSSNGIFRLQWDSTGYTEHSQEYPFQSRQSFRSKRQAFSEQLATRPVFRSNSGASIRPCQQSSQRLSNSSITEAFSEEVNPNRLPSTWHREAAESLARTIGSTEITSPDYVTAIYQRVSVGKKALGINVDTSQCERTLVPRALASSLLPLLRPQFLSERHFYYQRAETSYTDPQLPDPFHQGNPLSVKRNLQAPVDLQATQEHSQDPFQGNSSFVPKRQAFSDQLRTRRLQWDLLLPGAQSGSVFSNPSFGQASGFSGSAGEQGGFSRTAGASSGLVNRVANALANSSTMRAVLRRGVPNRLGAPTWHEAAESFARTIGVRRK
ncbi:hypothetical protein HNY73_006996 [Argiope bruennichi]|uniref:Uncharacterized protein n=1 Tax=Argiope bruennichi TaxID=94029 RepID=A0A8T0FCL4_ARGBR|nr:hypothetical protein HNY73_006996 [Argiope bruennichi]